MTAPRHDAVTLVVPADFLNALAAHGIGDGVVASEFRSTFQLPMMGPMDLAVAMTIVGVSFEMKAKDNGRLRATVTATGAITVHGDMAMEFPGLARVAGEVLVDPIIELRPDGSFIAQLDLPGSDLQAMHFLGFDGADAAGDDVARKQMSEMLFAAVGGDLFGGLAESLGRVGLELSPDDAAILGELGVAVGPADIVVRPGRMEVALPAVAGTDGNAVIVPATGTRVGVGLATGALSALVAELVAQRVGVSRLPFDVQVLTERGEIGGRVRGTRLTDNTSIPDLRAGWRYTTTASLVRDHIEISLREAWLELPLVPQVVNRFNRFLGGLAAQLPQQVMGPLSIRLPAMVEVPVRPDSDVTMWMGVTHLEVDRHGVEAIIAADLERS